MSKPWVIEEECVKFIAQIVVCLCCLTFLSGAPPKEVKDAVGRGAFSLANPFSNPLKRSWLSKPNSEDRREVVCGPMSLHVSLARAHAPAEHDPAVEAGMVNPDLRCQVKIRGLAAEGQVGLSIFDGKPPAAEASKEGKKEVF